MAVPSVTVFPLEPRGCLSENRQSGEVVPAMNSDAISVECGVQRAWGPADPPLSSVWRVHLPWLSTWDSTAGFYKPGLH